MFLSAENFDMNTTFTLTLILHVLLKVQRGGSVIYIWLYNGHGDILNYQIRQYRRLSYVTFEFLRVFTD